MAVLLQLSLYVLAVIRLTSSESTYLVIKQQENYTNTCAGTEQMLSAVSQIQAAIAQLQSNVDELNKAFNQQLDKKDGNLTALWKKAITGFLHSAVTSYTILYITGHLL